VATNIVLFETRVPAAAVMARIREEHVLVSSMGPQILRCVTNLNVDAAGAARAAQVIARILSD